MEFDYYQQYKDLPTPELIKVAVSPRDYLPEAVAVAKQILGERGISKEEMVDEEWKLARQEMDEAVKKNAFSDYVYAVIAFFRADNSGDFSEKWFGIFLLLYALYYLANMFGSLHVLVNLPGCHACKDKAYIATRTIFSMVYGTVALYYLLKQKPRGWSMALLQSFVLIGSNNSIFFIFYRQHLLSFDSMVTWYLIKERFWPTIIEASVIFFLFRETILEVFGITKRVRNDTLYIAGTLFGFWIVFS